MYPDGTINHYPYMILQNSRYPLHIKYNDFVARACLIKNPHNPDEAPPRLLYFRYYARNDANERIARGICRRQKGKKRWRMVPTLSFYTCIIKCIAEAVLEKRAQLSQIPSYIYTFTGFGKLRMPRLQAREDDYVSLLDIHIK